MTAPLSSWAARNRWIWIVAAQKLLSMVLICVCIGCVDEDQGKFSIASLTGSHSWVARLSFLDGKYYLDLARHWYSANDSTNAFYPLFPLAIRMCAPLFGGNAFATGLLLSNVFSIAGAFLFFRLVEARHGEKVALGSLALLLACPGAISFGLVYTESLFLFLAMLLCLGVVRRRVWLVCLSGCLLPLARPVG